MVSLWSVLQPRGDSSLEPLSYGDGIFSPLARLVSPWSWLEKGQLKMSLLSWKERPGAGGTGRKPDCTGRGDSFWEEGVSVSLAASSPS